MVMSNSSRNESDFYHLARRRRKRVRIVKRNKTIRRADRIDLAEEVDDRTLTVISRHL